MNRKQGDGCSSHWHHSEEAREDETNISSHGNNEMNSTNKANDPDFDCRSNSMKRLQEAIFVVAGSRVTHPPSIEITLHMYALLREIFSVNQAPNHPPYQEMICKAIKDLNEEGGSNESRISYCIKTQYGHDVLPWGHESLVAHHLHQMTSRGKIFMDSNGCYRIPLLAKPKGESSASSRRGRPPKKEGREKKLIYYGPKRKRGRPRKTYIVDMAGKEKEELARQ